MTTTLETIKFDYGDDSALFNDSQKDYWAHIESFYSDLRALCLDEVDVIESGTHKEWVRARINLHITTSLMRLLYLAESFVQTAKTFNATASAVHVKAMVEVPLHLGYLLWILREKHTFEEVREELNKLAWGNRSQDSGLTTSAKITQRELYEKADLVLKEIFPNDEQTINIVEMLYKDANATGHHNYEGRNILSGVQKGNIWRVKDRKEWFVFITNNIFQFFLNTDVVMMTSKTFVSAIHHYLEQLPDYFLEKQAKPIVRHSK